MRNSTSTTHIFRNPEILNSQIYQITNQIFSAVLHGFGFLLSVIGTIFLVIKGIYQQDSLLLSGYFIYGLSMCWLYWNSMMYHIFSRTILAPIFQIFDHSSIYLFIAGTYTPIILHTLPNKIGWSILGIEWISATIGFILELQHPSWLHRYTTYLYLIMGWLIVFVLPTLISMLHLETLMNLVLGGLVYSVGTYFYSHDDYAYFHVIWHFLVMVASFFFFISIYFYL